MTEKEIQQIVSLLSQKLQADNPGFVRRDLCDERSGTIKRMLYGLYALVGMTFLCMIAQLLMDMGA